MLSIDATPKKHHELQIGSAGNEHTSFSLVMATGKKMYYIQTEDGKGNLDVQGQVYQDK